MYSLLEKIQNRLSKVSGTHLLNISFWGNDISDRLKMNYSYFDHIESFSEIIESEKQEPSIYLVMGQLNYFQLEKLKSSLAKNENKFKRVIWVKSLVGHQHFYNCPRSLREEIDIDYVYERANLDIEELLECILSVKDGVFDE